MYTALIVDCVSIHTKITPKVIFPFCGCLL